jgi:hypothetical protein
MEGSPVKLLYAVVFALFPLAAPAQTQDPSILAAVCNDDHCDDSIQGSAAEVFSIEAILDEYCAVVTCNTEDEVATVFLNDPEDVPVGSIEPPTVIPAAEHAIWTDDDLCANRAVEEGTIASQIITPEPALEKISEDANDIETTGPTTRPIPAVVAAPIGESPTIE